MDNDLRSEVFNRCGSGELRQIAIGKGMRAPG
jgi:hypothetical protein